MLYTTEQIAKKYSGEDNNVTPYMITHTWIANGLKHIKGKRKGFLFKEEWVEEYLEKQINVTTSNANHTRRKKQNFEKQLTKISSYQVH